MQYVVLVEVYLAQAFSTDPAEDGEDLLLVATSQSLLSNSFDLTVGSMGLHRLTSMAKWSKLSSVVKYFVKRVIFRILPTLFDNMGSITMTPILSSNSKAYYGLW